MPPKKQRSISSRSDQQPFMVNLEMEVEEELGDEEDINNNEVISSTEESSSSSDYSNSLETNSTDACSPSPPTTSSSSSSPSSSPPSFISIPSAAIKSDDIIPAISIISPTPTEPKEVPRTGLGAGAATRFAFPSNSNNSSSKSADQPKTRLFEIGDEESEDSTTENRTLNLTETEERENGAENPKISKSKSRCCGNGCTKIGENPKNSHRRRSPSFSTLSSDDSTSLENGDRKNNLECICLEMCPITTTTTTKTERKTSAEEEDQNGEEVENAPHHDDLTTEEKEKEEPGRLLTTTAHTHRRNRSTHHRHHYHHRYHQHHQHPPPTPLPLLCNQQVSLYGPEQQSPAGAFVGSEQQQQLFSSKESLSSTSSAAAAAAQQQHQQHQHHQHQQKPAPQSAIMPMAINSMDKCSKLWRNDPTEPFPAKARPKPIKFEIPSAAKTMASYFRLPSPVSPAVSPAGQQQSGGLYSIGSEPIINHGFEPEEEEEEEEVSPGRGRRPLATLQVSQTLPPSASLASFSSVAAHSNLSSPEASRTPFSPNIGTHSPAAPMTNFVPIYISAKDLEAAFLGGGGSDQAGGGPPPQYTSAEQLQQKKKVVQLANLSATPSAYNSLNAKHKNSAVKRTKSFQERIQRALWGGTNGEGDGGGDPLPPPKAALCARMSILGKPLKQPRNRSLHLMRQRVWLYNFLQRPRGVLAYAYHLAVAITIILNLLFFALSTVSYLEPQSMNALRALDIIILSILTLELLALCWASSCVGKYQGWQGKFRFIFLSPFRLLDLLIIGVTAVVVWTCWLNSHQDYLQWLRCGMIFQILRLENRFKPWRMLSSVLWIERKHLLITVYMGFLILVTISYVVFFLEQEDPETLFTNIPVSLYWGVITVCTIGYGDMAPKTTAGRTVGALLAICGAVIYAIPAGIIATGLALKVQERNREKHINKRRIPAVRLIQCAWRCYAASANSTSSVTWWVAQKAVASGGNRGGGGFHRKLMDMYNGSQFSLMEDHHQHHSDHHHNGDHHQHNNQSTAASKQNSHSDLHALNLESGGGGGGGILSGAQKNAVRFIRAAQYEVALREFKNAFKPYDIKDVLQQYSEGHADVVGRVRCMQSGINAVHVALGGVMKMMAEMQHRQTEKIDRLEATVERLLRRLQEAEGDGGEGGDGHQGGNGNGHHHPPNSPYHSYSETSTIYARTPTLAQQPLPPPPPPPPTSSKEDEENSFNEVRTRHQNQQQQQQPQPPHHHSRNNSS